MPKSIKILALLGLLFLVGSVLGPLAEYVLPLGLIGSLLIWPGPDRDNPRLFKVMPWLWSLSFLTAVVLLGASFVGKELLPEDARSPSMFELIVTLVTLPPLLWTFWKRHPKFPHVMLISAVLMGAVYVYDYLDGLRDTKATIDFIGGMLIEAILVVYFWKKFKPGPVKYDRARE